MSCGFNHAIVAHLLLQRLQDFASTYGPLSWLHHGVWIPQHIRSLDSWTGPIKVHPSRAIFDNYNRQDDIGQTSVDPLNQQCAATNSHSYSFNSSEMATGSVLAWRWPKL